MAANDIRAGGAFVELYTKGTFKKDFADFEKKLKSFGTSLTNIGKKMIGLGAAISAPLVLAVQQFASMGDAMNKAAQRTGIAVEALSALKYAAEQSGLSFEDLEGALKKMEKAMFQAEDGSKEAQKSLAGLGLTVKDLKGLAPEKQFLLIADKLSHVRDAGARAAIAMEIFGKGGTAILPLIQDGAKGIEALTKRAAELGLIMSSKDAEAATKFGDTLADLWAQLKVVVFTIGAAVANALQPFATAALHIMKTVIDWTKANKNLVLIAIGVAAALVIAGTAFLALGAAITATVAIGSAVAAIFSFISGAIAFLMNPITLVIGGLIALGAYFLYASGLGAKALTWLGAKFQALGAIASEVLGGIADALTAGDIQLAAQILWVELQLAWAVGTHELMKKWIDFKYGFVKVAVDAFYAVLDEYEDVKALLVSAWESTVATFGDIFDGFISYFGNAWDNITSSVAKSILYVQSLFDGSDYDSLAKSADDQLEANKAQRDDAAQKRIADRAAQLEKDLADVQAQHDAAVAANDDEAGRLSGGADAAAAQELSDLDKKKADLQKQLDVLRKKAGDEKKNLPDSLLPPGKSQDLDDLLNSRAGIQTPAKSQGIFNIAALQSLQSTSDDYAKQTAKNTAETARNTRDGQRFG